MTEHYLSTERLDDVDSLDVTAISRLKHAQLWEACKKVGGQSALARMIDVHQGTFGEWVNLKRVPPKEPTNSYPVEKLRKIESVLFELTGQTLDELFPDSLRNNVAFLRAPKVSERTARIKATALYSYAVETQERLQLAADADHSAQHNELRDDIRDAMQTLPDHEAYILTKRYGLDGSPPMNQREIGEELGINKTRVSQIEQRAIRKLQILPEVSSVLVTHLD